MRKPPKVDIPKPTPAPYTPLPAYASQQPTMTSTLGPLRSRSAEMVNETRAQTQRRSLIGGSV